MKEVWIGGTRNGPTRLFSRDLENVSGLSLVR